MDCIDALILGIVQGLAEYLPISSSGHLEIFREILGLKLEGSDALEFDIVLHVATVLSTIVVLWNEFVPLCKSFFTIARDDKFFYVCKILLSCIPVAIVGLFFKSFVEQFFGDGLTVVGCCLLSLRFFFRLPISLGIRNANESKVSKATTSHGLMLSLSVAHRLWPFFRDLAVRVLLLPQVCFLATSATRLRNSPSSWLLSLFLERPF